ncbi:hypothetical protein L227DRAFT_422361 [Lentinus tigrinus ALCF2SS1-6]|uniref:Uncharacterized protein n=1 Tax=Lentinus tigrinus ALCF2SS1-6 TaxID=1328759 RepID=A0A5C2RS98_9APHY|nr:hypothetical protein L227DRAFT_422361 [Lentinus tigrinus ALCF2SS1-6]
MSSPDANDCNILDLNYKPIAWSKISQDSPLWDLKGRPSPAAPAQPVLPSPMKHDNSPFVPAASHSGGALDEGPHKAGQFPASTGYVDASNFGGVSAHAAHGPYCGALPCGSAPALGGPTSSVPSQYLPATAQAEGRGISSVASGSQQDTLLAASSCQKDRVPNGGDTFVVYALAFRSVTLDLLNMMSGSPRYRRHRSSPDHDDEDMNNSPSDRSRKERRIMDKSQTEFLIHYLDRNKHQMDGSETG